MAGVHLLPPGEQPTHHGQKLNWNYAINLTGEKVPDPDIHCCEICDLPILIYGRMLPCKHVFCYDCASKADKFCPRCRDAVSRMERCELGTIFLCTFGAPRNSHEGCRRTYLSQRDLQAHMNHRHVTKTPSATATAAVVIKPTAAANSDSAAAKSVVETSGQVPARLPSTTTAGVRQPVLNSSRGNLITIQLQGPPPPPRARNFARDRTIGNIR